MIQWFEVGPHWVMIIVLNDPLVAIVANDCAIVSISNKISTIFKRNNKLFLFLHLLSINFELDAAKT